MSETITAQGRSVNTITAEIVAITAQTNQMMVLNAIEVGRRLVEVKELIPHGEWGQYLHDEVSFSKSTANNLMKIYREYGENRTNLQALGDLPYTKMVRLLAVPEEEREEFIQTHDVESLSTRELEQAIRDREAARALLAEAQENANDAIQKARDMTARNQTLLEQLTRAQKDAERLRREADSGKVDKARQEGYEKARAELVPQLEAAQKAARKAQEEAQARTAQAEEAARKKEGLADEEAVAFNLLFKQIQEQFNVLSGYLLKFQTTRPELAAGAARALRAMLRQWGQTVEEKAV